MESYGHYLGFFKSTQPYFIGKVISEDRKIVVYRKIKLFHFVLYVSSFNRLSLIW